MALCRHGSLRGHGTRVMGTGKHQEMRGAPREYPEVQSRSAPARPPLSLRPAGSREAQGLLLQWLPGPLPYFLLHVLSLNRPSVPLSPVPVCLAGGSSAGAHHVWVEKDFFFFLI